jgi:RNA polymerase sigma-70 factor (ECF subfamily)
VERQEEFVAQLTSNQNRLYAYILSLLGDPAAADDVLQSVNLVLWRETDQWDPATSFMAWAVTIARYEVMTWRKKASREWLVFSDETLSRIEATSDARSEQFESRQLVLRDCLRELSERFRDLLQQRYADNAPLGIIAERLHLKPNAVTQALHRARQTLARCMQRKLALEGTP